MSIATGIRTAGECVAFTWGAVSCRRSGWAGFFLQLWKSVCLRRTKQLQILLHSNRPETGTRPHPSVKAKKMGARLWARILTPQTLLRLMFVSALCDINALKQSNGLKKDGHLLSFKALKICTKNVTVDKIKVVWKYIRDQENCQDAG